MSRSASRIFGVLLVALPSSVVSSLVTIEVAGDRARPPAVPAAVDPAFVDLVRRVDARLAAEPAVRAESQPVRRSVSQRADVERLEALVERLAAMFPAVSAGGAVDVIPRGLPVNHGELAALHALSQRDPDAAKRSTLLLTDTEVARRFGFPDDVGANGDGSVFWNYFHYGPDGERAGGTVFVFLDGRVAWHDISLAGR